MLEFTFRSSCTLPSLFKVQTILIFLELHCMHELLCPQRHNLATLHYSCSSLPLPHWAPINSWIQMRQLCFISPDTHSLSFSAPSPMLLLLILYFPRFLKLLTSWGNHDLLSLLSSFVYTFLVFQLPKVKDLHSFY